ncbi:AraC family transcriptional regulator [Cyanobacterium aponinum AL20118]|uniref:AraC family transcriptional regulator n=1 Tax=Cyanobacterium aponinum AL20115 TaxID=3090662 RepID=A0AAF0Z9E4_9CHRO|nr:AraC family transcriptional regulator [Cyanobacterium aponinum]WPF87966.1 AraC family transcriptional regulator [Cyanobacterium aponinum AL20115]
MPNQVIVNSPSIVHESVHRIIQVYQNYHSTGEDPKPKILDRHLIGLTTNQICYLTLKHNSDKLKEIRYSTEELMIFPAGINHWASWKNSTGIFLSIDNKLFDSYAQKLLDGQTFQLISHLKMRDSFLRELIGAIALVSKKSSEIDDLYLESLFSTLSLHLISNYTEKKTINKSNYGGLAPHKLSIVIDYIKSNLNEKITIATLANLLALSEYHFIRCFKESTGISPYQYILKERLKKAVEMIKKTDENLAHISLICGFSSQSQMSVMLKKHFNLIPKDLRDS